MGTTVDIQMAEK